MIDYEELKGKTIQSVELINNDIEIVLNDNSKYRMYHDVDCCERVYFDESKSCNLQELINSKIISIKEESAEYQSDESATITTYTFETDKGEHKIVWIGESNGYYRETPCFKKIN